jgi:predicted DsbA family dithiol-disulfide isomerase
MEQSSLVRLKESFDVEVEWRGFELHPETPVGGMPVASLFGGRSIEGMRARMTEFASEFGVEIVIPDHLPNTRRALAMSEFARDQNCLDAFRQAATEGYWLHGRNLEDDDDLAHMATQSGLEASSALSASRDATYLQRVAATREDGIDRMVTGVPTLFVGGMPVVGCQRYETFEQVALRAGLEPRT